MAVKPEDRPKLIGLLVGILGVIAYVLIVLVPKMSAGASPVAHTDAPPALTQASATTPQTAAADPAAALPDGDELPVPPVTHRDSFTPPPTVGKGEMPPPPKTNYAATAAAAPSLPIAPGHGPVGPATVQTTMPVPMQPAAPPMPPIELKGVILGDPAIAVLSVNGEVVQRQVGDAIFGGLKLAKVADAGITLWDGHKATMIAVGHAMPGTLPPVQTPDAGTVATAKADH